MSTQIKLSTWEMMIAANAGVMRQVQNLQKGRTPSYGVDEQSHWQIHIEGCLGEYALAKYLGVYWAGNGFRQSDVGIYEVRTGSKDNYRLILHPDDADDKYFWLLCGGNGKYEVKGWILGRDGKKKEYWQDPVGGRPAYFVPQNKLMPPTIMPTPTRN